MIMNKGFILARNNKEYKNHLMKISPPSNILCKNMFVLYMLLTDCLLINDMSS